MHIGKVTPSPPLIPKTPPFLGDCPLPPHETQRDVEELVHYLGHYDVHILNCRMGSFRSFPTLYHVGSKVNQQTKGEEVSFMVVELFTSDHTYIQF